MFEYKFSYEPDEFQKKAFQHITNNEHVFISVPTGAGKTTIAEFAIAYALHNNQNAIFTAPIKALCNQKFYEFRQKFAGFVPEEDNSEDDEYDSFYGYQSLQTDSKEAVGIVTGDVKQNESAPCLVMTTEVLRNMIFRRDSYLDATGWVIFDEVHYISNEERGQVWEEVIQWAPEHIRFVFLSATSPNREEFCKWVSETRKNQPVRIEAHENRPVPLQFWSYFGLPSSPCPENNLNDRPENLWQTGWFQLRANQQLGRKLQQIQDQNQFMQKNKTGWTDLIRKLNNMSLLPAVFFGFQKRRIEEWCTLIQSVELTNKKEKFAIQRFLKSTFAALELTEEQKNLPQVRRMMPALLNGIGFHHSGLLPFMKEVVEVLFSRGLIKILWATETFAMGLNMPTRTVVFTDTRKWDGHQNRLLDPSEWLQMAGRAGRRGFDSVGYVITLADQNVTQLTKLVGAQPKPMKSHFEVSYSVILHSLNQDKQKYHSFRDFASKKNNSKIDLQNWKNYRNELKALPELDSQLYEDTLLIGSLFRFLEGDVGIWMEKIYHQSPRIFENKMVLLAPDDHRLFPVVGKVLHWSPNEITVAENDITYTVSPWDVLCILSNTLDKVDRKFYGKIPFDIMTVVTQYWDAVELTMRRGKNVNYSIDQITATKVRYELEQKISELQYKLRVSGDIDYDTKLQWLMNREFVRSDETLTLKGKLARDIHSTHPLIMTECVLHALFVDAPIEVAGTILSSFMVPRKSQDGEESAPVPEPCQKLNKYLKQISEEYLETEEKSGVQSKETDIWLQSFSTKYQAIFWEWMANKTLTFAQWVEKTGWEEGLLIRWALRTEELARELADVGELIGNIPLFTKCQAIQERIKRDLVETKSIYWC